MKLVAIYHNNNIMTLSIIQAEKAKFQFEEETAVNVPEEESSDKEENSPG